MSQYPQGYPPQTVIVNGPPSNGLGLAGFIISLAGLLVTGGILCPIGLILSLVALFRRPRGFAIAGTILGAVGTLVPVIIFLFFGAVFASICGCSALGLGALAQEAPTFEALNKAEQRIQHYYDLNARLPSDADGTAYIDLIRDGNSNPLRYRRLSSYSYELRAAGQDGRYHSTDDRTRHCTVRRGGSSTTIPTSPRRPTTIPRNLRRPTPPIEPQ